jgi:NAD(P)-dependent dehydrogenase (short-subunit alcohol dehydrogenase family)
MDLRLNGKKAVITGGAVGIGRAIALDLAKEGVEVFFTSRNAEKIERTLSELQAISSGHVGFQCDIGVGNNAQEIITTVKETFGDIDILINNAGSTQGITDPYCPTEDWRKIFRLNLEVPVELNNSFIPHMKSQDWGRIINITAGAALENSGPVPYCASKAALTAYTRSMGRILAIEADNVIMVAVLPGVIVTEDGHWGGKYDVDSEHAKKYLNDRCPLGRFGSPDEISSHVVYLCSEQSTFAHGGIFLVDAGQAKHYMYNTFL